MSLCPKSVIHPFAPSRRIGALVVTVVTVIATIAVPGLVQPAGAASKGVYLGIDVAAHQHPGDKPIDWKAVRNSGVRFAFIKATEGAGRAASVSTNPWFGKDWKGAGSAGVLRGAYHYARPRYPLSTAASDAQRFMSVVRQVAPGELAPVLDLEETGGLTPQALATWIDTWMRETSRRAGRPAMIYTTRGFWTSYVSDTTKFAKYPLWMANHTSAARPVPLPGGWKAWTFWQYSANGRVAGISGVVDLNWSCGFPGSVPSGSKSSICTTTGTASAASSAGATVKASPPSTAKKSSATSSTKSSTTKPATKSSTTKPATKSSTTKPTTKSPSPAKSSTTKKTSTSATKKAPAAPPPPPPPASSPGAQASGPPSGRHLARRQRAHQGNSGQVAQDPAAHDDQAEALSRRGPPGPPAGGRRRRGPAPLRSPR